MISDINKFDAIAIANDARQGERALNAVYRFLGRFVAYPSDHAHVAHSLWVAHAHLMDRWESTPRIAFLSPEPASGKTRALEVTELLVPNAVSAINVTPAYLFRKVGEGSATILFDEIDTVFGPKAKENEEIRGLLNAGHRRGAVAGRCVVHGKQVMTEEIPAYAAVALAGLGWLPDTIMTRCVVIRMQRRKAGEHVEQYRRRLHLAEGERIRSHIEVWARSLPSEITWPELPTEIQDRDADVWEALIAVADLVGGMWSERARQAAIMLLAANREDKGSLGIKLLADLRLVFGDAEAKPTAAILEALRGIDESPWGDLKGKPLDDRGLARRLRQYGVKSDVIWFGNRQARGYHRAALADQWQRYLPPSPDMDVTSVTSVRPTTVTPVTPVTLSSGQGDRTCAQCNAPGGPLSILKNGGDLVYLHPECVRFWRADNLDIPDCLRRQAGSGL